MKVLLEAKDMHFYAQADEAAFFHAISSIPSIEKWWCELSSVYLRVARKDVDKQALFDLMGIFFRYRIAMGQLRQLETAENCAWFRGRTATYWHPHVFHDAPLPKLDDPATGVEPTGPCLDCEELVRRSRGQNDEHH